MARICAKCNSPIEEGGNFCTQCGSSEIRDDSPTTAAPIEAPAIANNPGLGSPISPTAMPDTEPAKSSFGDLPDFMSGSTSTEEVTTPQTTPTFSTIPEPTTLPPVNNDVQTPDTQQSLFPTEENTEGKKDKSKLVFIILGVVGVLLVISGAVSIVLSGNGKKEIDTTNTTAGHTADLDKVNKYLTDENSFRIGNDQYGYVSVPNSWTKYAGKAGSKAIQYTDNQGWILTLYSKSASESNASEWANEVLTKLKNGGATNISTHKTKINNFDAIELNGYYETDNSYLSTWFFNGTDGMTHYIALEGPSDKGDYFNIVFSYKEKE